MKIEIWSDIVCPFCYIGKARLDHALATFPQASQVEIVHRAFELDPRFPRGVVLTVAQAAARKYGMSVADTERAEHRIQRMANAEGLPYSIERPTANTFDLHRVLRFANESGLRAALTDRVFRANFSGETNVFDPAVLTRLAAEIGLDPDRVSTVLSSDAYAAEVRAESRDAKRRGIDSLPFMIIDGHEIVSGTQPVAAYRHALELGWKASHSPTNAAA